MFISSTFQLRYFSRHSLTFNSVESKVFLLDVFTRRVTVYVPVHDVLVLATLRFRLLADDALLSGSVGKLAELHALLSLTYTFETGNDTEQF
jgi:hypothetical protein